MSSRRVHNARTTFAAARRVPRRGVRDPSGSEAPRKAAMAEEVIGRSGELLSLAAFVEAVPNTGQALVLEGEAGIGKTVLWQEGLRLANEHGFRVLGSRSS